MSKSNELYHHGIKGQKWGKRRYQNEDGTWTAEGKRRRLGEFLGKVANIASFGAYKTIQNFEKQRKNYIKKHGSDRPKSALELVARTGGRAGHTLGHAIVSSLIVGTVGKTLSAVAKNSSNPTVRAGANMAGVALIGMGALHTAAIAGYHAVGAAKDAYSYLDGPEDKD